jgi:2-hydroxy-3-keto-5-methylthiopentenyl-1-phosphate phosphatase
MSALLRARPSPRWVEGWEVSCDFDGTITRGDVVQGVLARFADPAWREIEAEWDAGRMGSRECLERQTRLLQVEPEALAAWVDAHPVDPDAVGVFQDCAELGVNVRIVSDGYDWVIRRVLARLGLEHLPVFANRLVSHDGGRWSVEFPNARPGCLSGACKCALVAERRPRLHIGDGRSDACVSDRSDLVFAKDSLLRSRQARGLPSVAFQNFAEIRAALQGTAPLQSAAKPTASARNA